MSQQGIIETIADADETLFTLRVPEQPQVDDETLEAAEVHLLAFYKGQAGYRAIRNALELLDVLYKRGVTTPEVLAVLLEATGHPVTAGDWGLAASLRTSTPTGPNHDR